MQDSATTQKLLWLDLEMTGLDPAVDVILEVALRVTDWSFQNLGEYVSGIQHDPDDIRKLMAGNPFWSSGEAQPEALLKLVERGKSLNAVEQDILAFITTHFGDQVAVLAGNSIHQDRRFIRAYWPMFDARLHYRMLDVSAWKIVMEGKYGLSFPKAKAHRADDDITESVAELQFYLERGHF